MPVKSSTLATPIETSPAAQPCTLSDLHNDLDLLFRIQVLVHDLGHLTKQKKGHSMKQNPADLRMESTTHPLYISPPYLSDTQATKVLETVIVADDNNALTDTTGLTIEQAIYARMENFVEKRSASGDFRPCGPHDLQPIYLEVFGITKAELGKENLASRINRIKISDLQGPATTQAAENPGAQATSSRQTQEQRNVRSKKKGT